MVHIKSVTLAKACTEEEGGESVTLSLEQLEGLLGGSVQEVLLSVINAKGKGPVEG